MGFPADGETKGDAAATTDGHERPPPPVDGGSRMALDRRILPVGATLLVVLTLALGILSGLQYPADPSPARAPRS